MSVDILCVSVDPKIGWLQLIRGDRGAKWIYIAWKERVYEVRPGAFFSMFLVTRRVAFGRNQKKKKKNWGSQNQSCWPSLCHARNTCSLHLQTWLSGRRNFFTVIARRRKKNFVLLRSLMEVDDRINVSNHYSKKHDARPSCTFAKTMRKSQRPLGRIRRKPSESELHVHCLVTSHGKPKAMVLSVEMIERGLCWL